MAEIYADPRAESLKQADAKYGRETFEAAYARFMFEMEVRRNARLWRKMMSSNDLGEALVQWHLMNTEIEDEYLNGRR
jgi:hypothetical protein